MSKNTISLEPITIYRTGAALAVGIVKVDDAYECGVKGKCIIGSPPREFVGGEGVRWHRTLSGAMAKVELMKRTAIQRLEAKHKAQLSALENYEAPVVTQAESEATEDGEAKPKRRGRKPAPGGVDASA